MSSENEVQVTGLLAGDASTGCVWLNDDTGMGHGPRAVEWPDGYEVRVSPVQLIGSDTGVVVASEGHHIEGLGVVIDRRSACPDGLDSVIQLHDLTVHP